MDRPKDFADMYLQVFRNDKIKTGKAKEYVVILPIVNSLSEVIMMYEEASQRKDPQRWKVRIKQILDNEISKIKLKSLIGLKTKESIKKNIIVALYELTNAMSYDTYEFRELNRKIIKQRHETIKYLKKAVEFRFLNISLKESIKKEINRLEKFDKEKQTYHPIIAVDFGSTLEQKPAVVSGEWGKTFYEHQYIKFERMLNTPFKAIREGRPYKFFLDVLMIVIYKILNEDCKIPKIEARDIGAKIINEYFQKKPFGNLQNVKLVSPKQIEHALLR